MLGSRLTFGVFCEDNTDFVISVKYLGTYRVCNPQLVEESPNPHTFTSRVPQGNVLGFGGRGRDGPLLFTAPGDKGSMNKKTVTHY